jgi:hypothetical protein
MKTGKRCKIGKKHKKNRKIRSEEAGEEQKE